MAAELYDILILYNHDDKDAPQVITALNDSGIKIYDFLYHSYKLDVNDALKNVRAVVVLFGNKGWSSVQAEIAEQAIAFNTKMIPVVLRQPLKHDDYEELTSRIVGRSQLIDLTAAWDNGLQPNKKLPSDPNFQFLVTLIHAQSRPDTGKFDQIINRLIDGNEEERADILEQIQASQDIDLKRLSERLRNEISKKFSPEREKDFVAGSRDPQKHSSVRSRMLSCLIAALPEEDENKDLILQHLQPDYEHNPNVRYWTLSEIYLQGVTYIEEAVLHSASDPEDIVKLLAKVIQFPADEKTIRLLREKLTSRNEEIWKVLRILRVIAVPELADDVCDILDSANDSEPLAYDAFYALANPGMARAAVKRLEKSPGTKAIVNRVIRVLNGTSFVTVKNFSRMLLVFDAKEVNKALNEAAKDAASKLTARQIRDGLAKWSPAQETGDAYVAGYSADTINIRLDDLGVQKDVRILTAVMLAKEVTPPLAIGLFGDWGTGKSYFIKSMQAEVERIQDRDKSNANSPLSRHVVQIEFNAWHYADTNLWASLVSFILEKLADHVSPQPTPEEKHASFLAELSTAQSIRKQAESEKLHAQEQIDQRQQELVQLQIEREQKEIKLMDLRATDIIDLLSNEDKEDLQNSLDKMGVPAVINSIDDLQKAAHEAHSAGSKITALFISVTESRNRNLVIILLILILLVIPGIMWWIQRNVNLDELTAGIAEFASKLTILLGSAAVLIRNGVNSIKTNISKINDVRKRIEVKLQEKRNMPSNNEKRLVEEIRNLTVKEEEAKSRVAAAMQKVIELEERIRLLKDERGLGRFLADRTKSEDYRKHLGLISTIRRDFESLGDKLAHAVAENEADSKQVDRIILYVDDLDRCPSHKVMEILQAVHLLLAYPLFVVVVAVDPRWLLHSLTDQLSAFGNKGIQSGSDPLTWQTTPQNFLEKIFQIPYGLQPMTETGYANLINRLLVPNRPRKVSSVQVEVPRTIPSSLGPMIQNVTEAVAAQSSEANEPANHGTSVIGQDSTPAAIPENNETAFVVNQESLNIKDWEATFAEKLYEFIPSPRSAKRFSNIYRILKAGVSRNELSKFEGTAQAPGQFQVPMLLLALVIGHPAECVKLFTQILQRSELYSDAYVLITALEKEKIITNDNLLTRIRLLVNDAWFPLEISLFTEWIPKVSRFSFEVAKVADAKIGELAPQN